MYAITLQTGKRKIETTGYFASEDVANHVAGTLSGFDAEDGEGPVCGVVTPVVIDMSASVEEYEAAQAAAAETTGREQWANFYESFSDEQKALMSKFGPESLTAGA
jgi:hypothetical protein